MGGRFGVNLGGNLHKPRNRMVEEPFITFTEIAFSAVVFFIERSSVFHAATPTDSEVPTDKALIAKIFLCPGESSLFAACGEFFYRDLEDIA